MGRKTYSISFFVLLISVACVYFAWNHFNGSMLFDKNEKQHEEKIFADADEYFMRFTEYENSVLQKALTILSDGEYVYSKRVQNEDNVYVEERGVLGEFHLLSVYAIFNRYGFPDISTLTEKDALQVDSCTQKSVLSIEYKSQSFEFEKRCDECGFGNACAFQEELLEYLLGFIDTPARATSFMQDMLDGEMLQQ